MSDYVLFIFLFFIIYSFYNKKNTSDYAYNKKSRKILNKAYKTVFR